MEHGPRLQPFWNIFGISSERFQYSRRLPRHPASQADWSRTDPAEEV
jgi:hypothetical protein